MNIFTASRKYIKEMMNRQTLDNLLQGYDRKTLTANIPLRKIPRYRGAWESSSCIYAEIGRVSFELRERNLALFEKAEESLEV